MEWKFLLGKPIWNQFMSGIKLNQVYSPSEELLGKTPTQFLSNLGGASVIHVEGKDNSKCRVIVTLLHGNEPSGLKAIHHLLLHKFEPAVRTKIIIASVVASLTEPAFTHRMLPGKTDLNRCFSSHKKDLQSQLAAAITKEIRGFAPEAVVDIHNTSGSGPAFSVSISNSQEHLALAAHFTHRMVYTDIRLGSIMEQDYHCPIVTIEAGGAHDDEADLNAINGIQSFLSTETVFEQTQVVELLCNPRRLEIQPDSILRYDSQFDNRSHVTFRQDIEQFNFKHVMAKTPLAWIDEAGLSHFLLDKNIKPVSHFFQIQGNMLVTAKPLILFMITTRESIAKSDCLLYFSETQQ